MTRRDKAADALSEAAKRRGVLGKRKTGISREAQRSEHVSVIQKLPGASKFKPLWIMGLDETD